MGRPIEFDREQKLKDAMILFWTKGYDGVSLQNLLKSLDINNSSFYHSFGSKEQLFDEALEHYFHKIGANRVQPLLTADNVRSGLRAYFDRMIANNSSSSTPNGCFIANSAILVSSSNRWVAKKTTQIVRASKERLEGAFRQLLERGLENGELNPGVDPSQHARLLVTLMFGLNLITRVTKDKSDMEALANTAITMCCKPVTDS